MQTETIIARVGHSKSRTDRLALLHPDGNVSNYFDREWTRVEVAAWLAEKGLVLRADDTVVRA